MKRVNKYPKSTKFGRQNPTSERWNSEEQLLKWRELWADIVNRALEGKQLDTRIDHRSFAARGITEQPTIHEGVSAKAINSDGDELCNNICYVFQIGGNIVLSVILTKFYGMVGIILLCFLMIDVIT